MSVDVIPAPDIFVNASVTQETAPDHAVRRLLSEPGKVKSTEWILSRVSAMLIASGQFVEEKVHEQVELIRSFVEVVPLDQDFEEDDWSGALSAAAGAAGVGRVMTDHPDLLAANESSEVDFVSSEAWLVEQTTPPPPPGA